MAMGLWVAGSKTAYPQTSQRRGDKSPTCWFCLNTTAEAKLVSIWPLVAFGVFVAACGGAFLSALRWLKYYRRFPSVLFVYAPTPNASLT